MSWSVAASGLPALVKEKLQQQFDCPLADPPKTPGLPYNKAGLQDTNERETVEKARDLVFQVLDQTYHPQQHVSVRASGTLSYSDLGGRVGKAQSVMINIEPVI